MAHLSRTSWLTAVGPRDQMLGPCCSAKLDGCSPDGLRYVTVCRAAEEEWAKSAQQGWVRRKVTRALLQSVRLILLLMLHVLILHVLIRLVALHPRHAMLVVWMLCSSVVLLVLRVLLHYSVHLS